MHAAQSGLAQHANRLQPAEYFFDPLPLALTDLVTGMMRRARVNGAPALALQVLRHMRRHIPGPHFGHQFPRIVPFVGRQRNSPDSLNAFGHLYCCIALRRPAALCQFGVHHQPVAVLDQQIAAVSQLRFLAAAFAGQPRLRVRLRFMRIVAALSP
jgi:hypothetical protein